MRLALAVVLVLMIGGTHGIDNGRREEVRDVRFDDSASVVVAWGPLGRVSGVVVESEDVDAPVLPDVQGATASSPGVRGEADEETGGATDASAGVEATQLADGGRPLPPPGALPYVTQEPTSIQGQFFDGYRAAGGRDDARIDAMIFCESSWRLDPGGYHLGLSQFDPGTWATVSGITGYTDWRDPFSQGWNTATWASMVDPGTSAGWPLCWHAIEW